MFWSRKNKPQNLDVIKAAELREGQRFIYCMNTVEVLEVTLKSNETVSVRIRATHPEADLRTVTISLYSNLNILLQF